MGAKKSILASKSTKINMILSFILVIISMIFANIYVIYKNDTYNQRYKTLIENTSKEGTIKDYAILMLKNTEDAIKNNNTESEDKFEKNFDELESLFDYLDTTIINDESIESYNNLKTLLNSLHGDCKNALYYSKDSNKVKQGASYYESAEKKIQAIEAGNGVLLSDEVNYIKIVQGEIDKSFSNSKKLITLIIGVLGILSLVYSISFSKKIEKRLLNINDLADKISKGDLTYDENKEIIKNNTKNEFDILENTFYSMKKSLNLLIRNVRHNINSVKNASEDIAVNMNQSKSANDMTVASINSVNEVANIQVELINKIFSEFEIADSSLNSTINNVKILEGDVSIADKSIRIGKETLDLMITQIKNINDLIISFKDETRLLNNNTVKIDNVIQMVKNISDETNLLALNASIEAARAGEAGKSFSVVAEEVKKLATQSKLATEDISNIIGDLRKGIDSINCEVETSTIQINENNELAEKVINVFENIYHSNANISSITNDVNNNMNNLSQKIGFVKDKINKLDSNTKILSKEMESSSAVTEEQLALIYEVNSQAEDFRNLAETLGLTIEKFKL